MNSDFCGTSSLTADSTAKLQFAEQINKLSHKLNPATLHAYVWLKILWKHLFKHFVNIDLGLIVKI